MSTRSRIRIALIGDRARIGRTGSLIPHAMAARAQLAVVTPPIGAVIEDQAAVGLQLAPVERTYREVYRK